ncbi:MAG: nucleotide exchange factor GrpE [Steroidobacteraceae bacterium]
MNKATENSASTNQVPAGRAPEDGEEGAAGAGREAPAEGLRAALAQAEQSVRQQREQYLRAAAELENVRKRAQRDIESAHRYALERFAVELLPVLDSLELGVRGAAAGDLQSLLEGQAATLKLLEHSFEKFSIKPIDPIGQPFDPNLHEAVLTQEAPNAAPNSVLQVVQLGYELNGRLLRPARVVVATAPGTAEDRRERRA